MTNLDSHWNQLYKKKKYKLPYTFIATFEGQHNFCAYTDTTYLKKNLNDLLTWSCWLQIPFIIMNN